MSTTTAKALIYAKFASAAPTSEYTCPVSTRTIIDKFTATNVNGSPQTVTVYVVPNAGTVASSNTIYSAFSVDAGETADLTGLQNHILAAGETIQVVASLSSAIVIRCSGREIV